ncbi:hypothetical protein L1987_49297 [Smallanthus sonchifolius]|uniref:Uncharacterized protein n=1 Tax=Smallanthus sonchifolius TaxID=185202 RepID=A0ACB9FV90_9ASTR|nr:hypothetical protein L1987_49297 [Smallanthus sonchifolius]
MASSSTLGRPEPNHHPYDVFLSFKIEILVILSQIGWKPILSGGYERMSKIKEVLQRKKVFIVVDDIDEHKARS